MASASISGAAADGAGLPSGQPRALTSIVDGKAAALVASSGIAASGIVVCVLETDDRCGVAEIDLRGGGSPVFVSDADYAWDPALSPDGKLLAWHEWSFPNMAWDGSRIMVRNRSTGVNRCIAGGDHEAVGQPRFSPDGTRLAYLSDRTGFMNVWVAQADGSEARPLMDEPFEHSEPSWGPGQRSYAWSPDSTAIAWCRNVGGFAQLVVRSIESLEPPREIARGWHHGLDWASAGIVAVRSGARTPPQIALTEPSTGDRVILDRSVADALQAAGVDPSDCVEPELITWPVEAGVAHGLLFRPTVVRPNVPGGPAPPMLVLVHGGPTGQAVVGWSPRVQSFVEQGWVVFQPNFRGSTGYGRAYTQALARRWGDLDVADTAAGIRYLLENGVCDPNRIGAMGASSGGLTVLMLCALHSDLVRAGVSVYGVTDLEGLVAATHRFESRYLDRIVGILPDDVARFHAQSPITHASQIKVPVLLLHGDADRTVPLSQTEAIVAALDRAGTPVEYHVYEGEGHGWSRAETTEDELRRVEAFLTRTILET